MMHNMSQTDRSEKIKKYLLENSPPKTEIPKKDEKPKQKNDNYHNEDTLTNTAETDDSEW